MVDVDPSDLVGPYTPRDSDLVDAVAETRRIADQSLRANPMKNAVVDSGLTRWVGNYGGDFAWFGEFLPYDKNQLDQYGRPRPQRGISFVRDDPKRQSAFALFDFDPKVGVPLRQRVSMRDADGYPLMLEGYSGGRSFPDHPIPMYPRINIEPGLSNGTDDIPWIGSGNIVGNRLDFIGGISSSGTVTITYFIRVVGVNGAIIDSPTRVQVGPVTIVETISLSTLLANQAADFITVEMHTFRSAGTGTYFPRPQRCRTYSDYFA